MSCGRSVRQTVGKEGYQWGFEKGADRKTHDFKVTALRKGCLVGRRKNHER
jgi:hypothetical protein